MCVKKSIVEPKIKIHKLVSKIENLLKQGQISFTRRYKTINFFCLKFLITIKK